MDCYCIAPFNHLNLVWQFNRHLLIVPYLEENQKYAEFYLEMVNADRNPGAEVYIILDNGVIEEKKPSMDHVLDWARRFKEGSQVTVVAPDFWKSSSDTIFGTEAFLNSLSVQERRDYRIMGVPHGKDIRDFLNCLSTLEGQVDVIGWPYKEWGDTYGYSRPFMIKYGIPISKDIHLLGLWNAEEITYHNFPEVKSFDTSMPFRLAKKNMILTEVSVDTDSFDWNMELTNNQKDLAADNLKQIQQLGIWPKRSLFL